MADRFPPDRAPRAYRQRNEFRGPRGQLHRPPNLYPADLPLYGPPPSNFRRNPMDPVIPPWFSNQAQTPYEAAHAAQASNSGWTPPVNRPNQTAQVSAAQTYRSSGPNPNVQSFQSVQAAEAAKAAHVPQATQATQDGPSSRSMPNLQGTPAAQSAEENLSHSDARVGSNAANILQGLYTTKIKDYEMRIRNEAEALEDGSSPNSKETPSSAHKVTLEDQLKNYKMRFPMEKVHNFISLVIDGVVSYNIVASIITEQPGFAQALPSLEKLVMERHPGTLDHMTQNQNYIRPEMQAQHHAAPSGNRKLPGSTHSFQSRPHAAQVPQPNSNYLISPPAKAVTNQRGFYQQQEAQYWYQHQLQQQRQYQEEQHALMYQQQQQRQYQEEQEALVYQQQQQRCQHQRAVLHEQWQQQQRYEKHRWELQQRQLQQEKEKRETFKQQMNQQRKHDMSTKKSQEDQHKSSLGLNPKATPFKMPATPTGVVEPPVILKGSTPAEEQEFSLGFQGRRIHAIPDQFPLGQPQFPPQESPVTVSKSPSANSTLKPVKGLPAWVFDDNADPTSTIEPRELGLDTASTYMPNLTKMLINDEPFDEDLLTKRELSYLRFLPPGNSPSPPVKDAECYQSDEVDYDEGYDEPYYSDTGKDDYEY
ncbi:hypothetical protein EDC01DRAFT_647992 [Geopyxis carbonaria]|nr:hypothetical protein EDC01DRAFT_647992 [Geopyxis carbonaria]